MIYKCRDCNETLIRQWSMGQWVWEHLRAYRHEAIPVFVRHEHRGVFK